MISTYKMSLDPEKKRHKNDKNLYIYCLHIQ